MPRLEQSLKPRADLDPRTYVRDISSTKEYSETRNTQDHESEREAKGRRMAAVAIGAEVAAEKYPDYSFRSNMLKTISQLSSFYKAQLYAQNYEQHQSTFRPSKADRDKLKSAKADLIEFNHTLRETIEAAGNENIGFNELLGLMTQQFMSITQTRDGRDFHDMAKVAVIGMRNEYATEMILIQHGVEFDQGDAEQDARGGDFVINGTLVDVKASRQAVERAKERAIRNGHSPKGIVWSGTSNQLFGNRLTLDPASERQAARYLIPAINQECGTDYPVEI